MKKIKNLFSSLLLVRVSVPLFLTIVTLVAIMATTVFAAEQAFEQILVKNLTQKIVGSNPDRPQFLNYATDFLKSDGKHRINRALTVVDYLDSGNAITLFPSIDNRIVALTPAATISLDPTLAGGYTLVPGQDETINFATVPTKRKRITITITTSGTTSRTITFGTNTKSTGTLATGTTSGKVFTISFESDGVNWNEQGRSTAM